MQKSVDSDEWTDAGVLKFNAVNGEGTEIPENPITENPVTEENSAIRPETFMTIDAASTITGIETDDNGRPDFLDFYGVTQLHVTNSVSGSLVPLDTGQEYTFEISKNLTEGLGGILPNISFYDPSNSLLYLDVTEEIIDVTTAAYTEENPSIICYTIKAEVLGNCIVKLSNGEAYSGAYLYDDGEFTHYSEEKSDTGSVLFIYKERFNENGKTRYSQ